MTSIPGPRAWAAGISARQSRRLEALMAGAGVAGLPDTLARSSLRSALKVSAVVLPLSLACSAYVSPAFLALLALPAAVYLLPELRLRDRATQRRERVEMELPFFSILVNVLASAGVGLFAIFEGLAGSQVFPAVRLEAQRISRDVKVFGMNPIEACERLAAEHPSKKFEAFLLGYASKVRTGAEMSTYLEGESGFYLRELEDGWGKYASRVGVVGSLMITVFGVVPLLLLVVGFVTPSSSTASLALFTLVGVPLVTVVLIFLAGRMQPAGEEPVGGKPVRALVAGAPLAAVGYLLGQPWAAAAGFILGFSIVYGMSVRKGLKRMKETDEGLPAFLKDLMEFKRQDYDLGKALLAVSSGSKYSPALDETVRGLAGKLRTGTPLGEAAVEARTRLAKVVFFVLREMAASGGGTLDTMFQLSRYATKVTEMKRSAQAEMKPYLLLSYATPLLLAFGVTFVGSVLSSLGSGVRVGSAGPGGFEGLRSVADLLIVMSAGALGLVGAKITDLTVKNTLRAATGVGIASAALLLLPLVNLGALMHGAL